MHYPEWAPNVLVDRLKNKADPDKKFKVRDPDAIISDMQQRGELNNITNENIEALCVRTYTGDLFFSGSQMMKR